MWSYVAKIANKIIKSIWYFLINLRYKILTFIRIRTWVSSCTHWRSSDSITQTNYWAKPELLNLVDYNYPPVRHLVPSVRDGEERLCRLKLVDFGDLGVTCSTRNPRFAGSNPAEVDGFFSRRKNPDHKYSGRTLSRGCQVWDFRLIKEPQAWKNRPLSKI